MAAASVQEYLSSIPTAARPYVERIRVLMIDAAPGVGEKISYGIIGFTRGGRAFAYLAGYAKHVSIHPVPTDDEQLLADLEPYRSGPGTCRFPLREPLPEQLIVRMISTLAAPGPS